MRVHRPVILFLLLAFAAKSTAAQNAGAPAPAATPSVSAEMVLELAAFEKKAVRLAEAVAAEKLSWRPGDGVRSIHEVILHIAQTNYSFPAIMGVKPPAGVDVAAIGKLTDRDQMIAALKASFDHARTVLGEFSPADLDRVVRSNWTVRRAVVFMLRHGSEHTGQLIAYARMVGITPPWTEEAQRRQQPPAKQN